MESSDATYWLYSLQRKFFLAEEFLAEPHMLLVKLSQVAAKLWQSVNQKNLCWKEAVD